MASCELLQGCPFFGNRMKVTDGLGALYKQRYCLGDYATCARYMVSTRLGRPAVPADLYPNMTARAQDILASTKPGR